MEGFAAEVVGQELVEVEEEVQEPWFIRVRMIQFNKPTLSIEMQYLCFIILFYFLFYFYF